MKFIFTDRDQYFKDEYQEAWLSEETGWWTPAGEIYVWTKGQEQLKQIGVAVHEVFEWFVIVKIFGWLRKDHRTLFSFFSNSAHNISNVLEFVASCGRADQYWGKQDWYGGKDQGFVSVNRRKECGEKDLEDGTHSI